MLEGGASHPLAAEGNGYFSGNVEVGAGALYRLSVDGAEPRPDPASRFQPSGPHGPSEVIDPSAYAWHDAGWLGPVLERPVLYELHVGTFTPEGTWAAAGAKLSELADLGISVIELMPVAAFPGRFGWGYDGVNAFAPTQLYGRPDDFRGFVDAAHGAGLGVILDVVYNHFGPDGCYLSEFSPHYFSERSTEWGAALNFDGPESGPVREYFVANARHWIAEYHLDGLRLDATQSFFDASELHIVAEIVAAVRAAAVSGRRTLVIAENERQQTDLLRSPERGGWGVDAAWNDDFHHSARVALTHRSEAYYSDYRGTCQELISALRWGYLYQGQYSGWQRQQRGASGLDLDTRQFVIYLQNHDQVANSAAGSRLHDLTGPGLLRAMTALLLLAPAIPLLFQGQEFAASAPFMFFADHRPQLSRTVAAGRREFLSQFPSIATSEVKRRLADPGATETFRRCVLDHGERERNAPMLALHRDLIALSRTPPFLQARRATTEGAVLGPECLLLRFLADDDSHHRLLIVNLGGDLRLAPLPEPLLAPPRDLRWALAWSSEEPRYGGLGAPDTVASEPAWLIPGWAAVVLHPMPRPGART